MMIIHQGIRPKLVVAVAQGGQCGDRCVSSGRVGALVGHTRVGAMEVDVGEVRELRWREGGHKGNGISGMQLKARGRCQLDGAPS